MGTIHTQSRLAKAGIIDALSKGIASSLFRFQKALPSPGGSDKYIIIAIRLAGLLCKRQPCLAKVSVRESRGEKVNPESSGFKAVHGAMPKRTWIEASPHEAGYIAAPGLPQSPFHLSEWLGVAAESIEMDATFGQWITVVCSSSSHCPIV